MRLSVKLTLGAIVGLILGHIIIEFVKVLFNYWNMVPL